MHSRVGPTLGDIRTEGDLIVAGELHCEGNLAARSFVRARTFKLKGTGAVDGGMETVEEFNVAGRMRHKGALEIQRRPSLLNLQTPMAIGFGGFSFAAPLGASSPCN
jgi:hypothetical protein